MSLLDLISVVCACKAELQVPAAFRETVYLPWLAAHSGCLPPPATESTTKAPPSVAPEDSSLLDGVISSIIQLTLLSSPLDRLTIQSGHVVPDCTSAMGTHRWMNLRAESYGAPPSRWNLWMDCQWCTASLSLELILVRGAAVTGLTLVKPDSNGSAATSGPEEYTTTVVPSTESASTPLPKSEYTTRGQGDDEFGHYLNFPVKVRGLGAMPNSPAQVAEELVKFWSGRTSLFGVDHGILHVEVY